MSDGRARRLRVTGGELGPFASRQPRRVIRAVERFAVRVRLSSVRRSPYAPPVADSTLIVGLVGVGGTLLGASTGAMIAARAALRVERRREERTERQEAAKLRAAARLVWLDLAQCDTSLLWAEKRGRWSPAKVPLPLDAWEQHRDRLAVEITDQSSWAT